MIGRVLKQYRVEEKLGEGGMGVVYRAWDERLRRTVALKVLPEASLADDAARRQLRHEAAALLRLNHPRIGTIFDFDTADGVDFIVMEFAPGTTLEHRLAQGPLPRREALAIALQIAEALEEAHEHNVIHRDLKPGNVIVSPKGQVKVLDFGLAKLLKPAGTSSSGLGPTISQSEDHAPKGTLAYMAPEQLLTGETGARTDLYAFGVVLYEMLTGDRPFKGETTLSLVNAIVHETPRPPGRVVHGGLPSRLEKLVLRCLEKNPARRFSSAQALLAELRPLAAHAAANSQGTDRGRLRSLHVGLGATTATAAVLTIILWIDPAGLRERLFGVGAPGAIHAIAVLPLANLSGDPQQEYFTDGMTDALITQLTQISALTVISRTSIMRYKTTRAPLRKIAGELGVDAVIEGSVLRSGNQVRITAELVQASSDRQLWAQSYDRSLDDVLSLQREVARSIGDEIRIQLTPRERANLSPAADGGRAGEKAANIDPTAQEAYLKGRYYAGNPSEAMLRISLKFFQEAIDREPRYAAAHAGLANSWVMLASGGAMTGPEAFTQAKTSAEKALALDDRLSEAHLALALARFYGDWDWAGAEAEFKRTIALNPGDAQVHHWYSTLLSAAGRHEEAIAEARRAEGLDPLSLAMRLNVGACLYYSRRYQEAVEQFRRTQELEPGYSRCHYWLGLTLQQIGRHKDAIDELRLVDGPQAIGPLGYAYAGGGNRSEAGKMLTDLAQLSQSGQAVVSPLDLATICAGLGEKDQAFEWLNKALQERGTYMTTIKVDPLLDPLRGDPRFASLVRRVGVPT